MNWFRLKACLKCHGDLALDEGDWLCLQCGTYYYAGLYRSNQTAQPPEQRVESSQEEKGSGSPGYPVGVWSGREALLITCVPHHSTPFSGHNRTSLTRHAVFSPVKPQR